MPRPIENTGMALLARRQSQGKKDAHNRQTAVSEWLA
jgi:hypothetical protein